MNFCSDLMSYHCAIFSIQCKRERERERERERVGGGGGQEV